ncbi:MAG: hypothetical protein Fues2KO_46160 [Fuerstiella sp.]
MRNSPEQDVIEFYRTQQLDGSIVDRLRQTQSIARETRRWKQVARWLALAVVLLIAVSVGVAAGVFSTSTVPAQSELAAGSSDGVQVSESNGDFREPEFGPNTNDGSTGNAVEGDLPADRSSTQAYRLVGFRSHGPACPFCRETQQVYQSICESHLSDRVHCEFWDVGSADGRQGAADAGWQSLLDGRAETAFLALATARGEIVKEFKPSEGADSIRIAILDLIQQR